MIEWEEGSARGAAWEWKIPLALFLAGLAALLAWGFQETGPEGAASTALFLALVLFFYLPSVIAAMYLTAWILGVSFGIFKTALLKMAGLLLFTLALNLYGEHYHLLIWSWLAGVALTYLLFSQAFDLEFQDVLFSVLLISLFRLTLAILMMMILFEAVSFFLAAP